VKIKFWKMHGAKNDFVLIDDRTGMFPADDQNFIRHLAARRSGIGAEGIVLIQPSRAADFFMRFYNPDGGEADMCGNAARCTARLANELNIAGERMSIETAAGCLEAEILDESRVQLRMTEPREWLLNEPLEMEEGQLTFSFVNTGVPHVVMRTGNLRETDVRTAGAAIRRHRRFAPAGANVNFIEITPDGALLIRTYERGVEDETPACGTGITAAGLIAAKNGWVELPVIVHAASGDVLTVDAELTGAGAKHVMLSGPTAHVYEGEIEYKE